MPPPRGRATPPAGERYRRSPALVLYWAPSGPVCFDAISTRRSRITPDVVALLEGLTAWTRAGALARRHPELGPAADVQELLEALVERGLVQRHSAATADWPWRHWTPEAAFFHFGTRDGDYADRSPQAYDMQLREKARRDPPPIPTKTMEGSRIDLPPAGLDGSLHTALHARRTWRQFAARPLSLDALGTLVQLTWGVQKWGVVEGQGRVALKTSPSGGARHSIEAYVIAMNVAGLQPGVYHYDAQTHELVDLGRTIAKEGLAYALANQRYFLRAGALVIMSAVFARAMWRYPYSRAYRSILAEAGHLGQTFCLTATALGLAPFCTMAFRDRELEDLIGIDGISESAMYVVGVGTRPRGKVLRPGAIPRGRP